MSKYEFPKERMREVYDSLDETGGMLMKDTEFQFWVEKIVEEESVKYRDIIEHLNRQIYNLRKKRGWGKMCWHKWTKWETYLEEGSMQKHPFSNVMLPYSEKRQKRVCIKCGREQDREMKE